MNYEKIYNQIITRARQENRSKDGVNYYENHHIIPKCLNGLNEESNLVLLTGREHFICHWILTKIHPCSTKLVYAFWAMCNQKIKIKQRGIPQVVEHMMKQENYFPKTTQKVKVHTSRPMKGVLQKKL
jgi:hypothetical protein